MENRSITLLRAARDLLMKQNESGALISYPITVHYDDADCDGYCLLDDISAHLAETEKSGQMRLTDPVIAANLQENIEALQKVGIKADTSTLRYIKLAAYEDEEPNQQVAWKKDKK